MTPALTYRAAPSFYSGMILALIALAFVLEASFIAALVTGRGIPSGAGGIPAPLVQPARAAVPAVPCVNG